MATKEDKTYKVKDGIDADFKPAKSDVVEPGKITSRWYVIDATGGEVTDTFKFKYNVTVPDGKMWRIRIKSVVEEI